MKNFKILLLQELHSQVKSFTFVVMIPVALAVSLLVSNLQLTSFKDRREVFEEQQRQSQERLNNIYFYSQLKVDVYMPPSPLSVFAKGLDESIGNKITVSAIDLPEPAMTSQRSNAFIKIFNNIDISGIVRILSIFIVLMAACPIALEREQQTGKLIFAGSVGRFEYYLSKYVALMVVAFIMTLITFSVPVVWMLFDPRVGLSFSDFGSVVLIMLAAVLYLSVFVLISLAVSAVSPKVSIAALSGLMVWVMLVYVYPYTTNTVINKLVSVPSVGSIKEQTEKIDFETLTDLMSFQQKHNLSIFNSNLSMRSEKFGIIVENRGTVKTVYENTKTMLEYTFPKIWERNNLVEAIQNEQKTKQFRKKELYDRFAFFVPDRIFRNLCEGIAHTGYDFREQQFTEAAKNYRSLLIDYIRSEGGFGYAFFTQMPVSEMRDNWNDYPKDIVDRYCKNPEPLNTAGMPQFKMPRPTADSAGWIVLLLVNIVFGSLSVMTYNKFFSF